MGKNIYLYLRIILNLGGEFELILEILPGYGDIVSWITIFFHYACKINQVCRDMNHWVRVNYESPTNNTDNAIHCRYLHSCSLNDKFSKSISCRMEKT